MADKIKVNTGSLSRTKENVSKQIKEVRNQIRNMRQDVAVMNAMWEGEAHTAFNAEFLADIIKLENLCKSLDGIVSYEGNAITEYNKCENKVATLISSIKV